MIRNVLFLLSTCLLAFAFTRWYDRVQVNSSPVVKTGKSLSVGVGLGNTLSELHKVEVSSDPKAIQEIIDKAPRDANRVPLVKIEDLFAYSPILVERFEAAVTAHRHFEYDLFLTAENISGQDQDRFFNILKNREVDWVNSCIEAAKRNVDLKDPQIDSHLKEVFSRGEAELETLLGAKKYEALLSYRKGSLARNGLGALNTLVITSSDSRITPNDFLNLVSVVTSAGVFRDGKADARSDFPVGELEASAKGVLNEQQQDVFQLVLGAQQVKIEESNALRRKLLQKN